MKTMTVNELKNLMNLAGWEHEQTITVDNITENSVEGLAEITSRNSQVPFEICFNESFKLNTESGELSTVRDDSLYGIWWFEPELKIVDDEGEEIDSLELDKQGFKPEFSQVDYSELIEKAKDNE